MKFEAPPLLRTTMGAVVGLLVASTLPDCPLTAATSAPVASDRTGTLLGTGLAAVGLDGITTRGSATGALTADFAGKPKVVPPSVTGMGGKLELAAVV